MAEFEPHSRNEWLLNEIRKNTAGEGGNPNEVETATGTLANPFGSINAAELAAALESGDASASVTFDFEEFSGIKLPLIGWTSGGGGMRVDFASISSSYILCMRIIWGSNGNATSGKLVATLPAGQVTDITDSLNTYDSTLTVIWHPLPEGG